ncbi:uncharacterized protein LOC102722984 [Oryza brachyantha]|uniref:uncharacterized protein LOC102722984 n=1 Tax=Oryza brachyantha TaxID=4533 RepID=UPI001ADC0C09|nr:uncharacterized protein LOC102722984 [Oryza brachyantha]
MQEHIWAESIEGAIYDIIPYLDDREKARAEDRGGVYKSIYFNGWFSGVGASAVLRAIAEDPPQSLTKKFDKIIHIDCSRWKSRRALQRTIADELKLSQHAMALFDRQDEEDDFSMVGEGSRAEIGEITRVIFLSLLQHTCLVLFHSGGNDIVDLYDYGLPPVGAFGNKVLWTFGGRLRRVSETTNKLNKSHLFISAVKMYTGCSILLWEEATEISLYTHKLGLGVSPEVTRECLLYLLSLDHNRGSNIIDYNWTIHAANYWVCDGIIVQGGQDNKKVWEVARALHQEIRLEDYSSNSRPNDWGDQLYTPLDRWIFTTKSNIHITADTTSIFLASKSGSTSHQPLVSLPIDMFHQADQLRVLKLCHCTFNFLSPPFHCCHNLRFLGLDSCMDSPQGREDSQGALEIFQRLWVLDICNTDWELDFPQETEQTMHAIIREIHIKNGRIWHKNLAWRRLQNLHKLRVIEPTSSWGTGEMDEFIDMVKLEHLDLSGNSKIQVLPTLARVAGLKNLVLDGCVRLKKISPEGLPPLLETFRFDAGSNPMVAAQLVKISLAGCVRLKNFLLCGALPELEELNLSGTSIRKVDLSDEVVRVQGLKKVFLIDCKQLRAILWWKHPTRRLEVLCIDNHERNSSDQGRAPSSDPSSIRIQQKNHDGYVITSDARIIQSLLVDFDDLITRSLYLYLYIPPSTSSRRYKGKSISSTGEAVITTKTSCYNDVLLHLDQGIVGTAYDQHDITSWPAPSDFHVEVGEGISLTNVESNKGIQAIDLMICQRMKSMHVHDNSRMASVNPKLPSAVRAHRYINLEWCRVERCPKLQAVFDSHNSEVFYSFESLEIIWASDLLAAGCIWHKETIANSYATFIALGSIHLHNCPMLKYVHPFGDFTLPSLETLHITHCAHLRHIFPREAAAQHTVKEFKMLKHIYLDELPSLEGICEGCSMSAPKLQCVNLRGCSSLRHLPAVDCHPRPIVNCEKDCWDKLEWDGLEVAHHPSLYEMCQSSSYYKNPLPRGTLLR